MKQTIRRYGWVLLLLVTACARKPAGTLEIKGTFKNIGQTIAQYPRAFPDGHMIVYLYEIPFSGDGNPIELDSAIVTIEKNEFVLTGHTSTTGVYEIKVDNGPMIPVINDVSELSMTIDLSNSDEFYTVSGSAASEQLRNFIFTYGDKREALEQTMDNLDSLKRTFASDNEVLSATSQKNKKLDEVNSYVKNFLAKTGQPALASFALGFAASTLSEQDLENELNQLLEKFPSDSSLLQLKQQIDLRRKQLAEMEQEQQANSWVGKKAPAFSLPDTQGKEISLASFKGKYLLVDFWASWCGPCRNENPNVVAAYNRYKDKNFTVLGVSLDRAREPWLQAIQDDHLTWTQVSDLAYWNSKAVTTFNFNGIPFNLLIDPQGTVIAENLRGDNLFSKLGEVLK